MNDAWSRFVVFLLGDPHLLEGGQGTHDRSTDPDGVLLFWRGENLNLHGGWSQRGQFLGHTFTNSLEHSGSAGKDDVLVEILTNVDITPHDGLEGRIVNARELTTDEVRLEEDLGAPETLVPDRDDVAIRKLVGLLVFGGLRGLLHLGIEVKSAGRKELRIKKLA